MDARNTIDVSCTFLLQSSFKVGTQLKQHTPVATICIPLCVLVQDLVFTNTDRKLEIDNYLDSKFELQILRFNMTVKFFLNLLALYHPTCAITSLK